MSEEWRNDPATERQKAKLFFFGCTWDEGITKGQASDAIDECVRKFPEREFAYQNRPATEEQKALLRKYGKRPLHTLTYARARDKIKECEGGYGVNMQRHVDYWLKRTGPSSSNEYFDYAPPIPRSIGWRITKFVFNLLKIALYIVVGIFTVVLMALLKPRRRS
jgi:hypothetical protein